ncbi:MAG: hypothetical protein LBH44_01900 [Treponema sp.]|jgi:hypothetical protein|nr:hypothetical protein [Treponema sp.]
MFTLPIFAAVAAVKAVSIAELVSIGAGAIGIGAGIKGLMDYRKANDVQKSALNRYQAMAEKIKRKIKQANIKLSDFGELKLETYNGVVKKSVAILSRFKNVYLSAHYNNNPLHLDFMRGEIDNIEKAEIKASDVFSCLSAGINSAVQEKYSPPFLSVGAFGFKNPQFNLAKLPFSAIMTAGLDWGMSGSRNLSHAQTSVSNLDRETEKMKTVLVNIKNFANRIDEGEHLITVLNSRLEPLLAELEQVTVTKKGLVPLEIINKIEIAISLTRALKQIIDVDVCVENGNLSREAGVLFSSLAREFR